MYYSIIQKIQSWSSSVVTCSLDYPVYWEQMFSVLITVNSIKSKQKFYIHIIYSFILLTIRWSFSLPDECATMKIHTASLLLHNKGVQQHRFGRIIIAGLLHHFKVAFDHIATPQRNIISTLNQSTLWRWNLFAKRLPFVEL